MIVSDEIAVYFSYKDLPELLVLVVIRAQLDLLELQVWPVPKEESGHLVLQVKLEQLVSLV